jgi:hypothetical protein
MSEFNRMTIVAASEAIQLEYSQNEFTTLATQWGIADNCGAGALLARTNSMANLAILHDPDVFTPSGMQPLGRAMIECAISFYPSPRQPEAACWKKLIAGLRMDGFEIVQPDAGGADEDLFGNSRRIEGSAELKRMLPNAIPNLSSRDAEDELQALLKKHDFIVSSGHLQQAINNFSLGNWAAANAQLRTFIEDCLSQIAVQLGCDANEDSASKRRFLGEYSPPFLLADYNEWHSNVQKPQYVQGLWSRLHPEGSHPGLSEEDDATFRMQIVLISARLLMRRFDQRVCQR